MFHRMNLLNVDPRSPVRLPQAMGPAELPGRNGEDLISCLFYLQVFIGGSNLRPPPPFHAW